MIDPRTGWPAAGVLSASVVAADAALADALSTAFFVGGSSWRGAYCAAHRGRCAIVTPTTASAPAVVIGDHAGARRGGRMTATRG